MACIKITFAFFFAKNGGGGPGGGAPEKIFLYKFVKIKLREKLIITYVIRGGR